MEHRLNPWRPAPIPLTSSWSRLTGRIAVRPRTGASSDDTSSVGVSNGCLPGCSGSGDWTPAVVSLRELSRHGPPRRHENHARYLGAITRIAVLPWDRPSLHGARGYMWPVARDKSATAYIANIAAEKDGRLYSLYRNLWPGVLITRLHDPPHYSCTFPVFRVQGTAQLFGKFVPYSLSYTCIVERYEQSTCECAKKKSSYREI